MTACSIIDNIESLSVKYYGDHTLTRTLLTSVFLTAHAGLSAEQQALVNAECKSMLTACVTSLQQRNLSKVL